jgi:hypothetical protein
VGRRYVLLSCCLSSVIMCVRAIIIQPAAVSQYAFLEGKNHEGPIFFIYIE